MTQKHYQHLLTLNAERRILLSESFWSSHGYEPKPRTKIAWKNIPDLAKCKMYRPDQVRPIDSLTSH